MRNRWPSSGINGVKGRQLIYIALAFLAYIYYLRIILLWLLFFLKKGFKPYLKSFRPKWTSSTFTLCPALSRRSSPLSLCLVMGSVSDCHLNAVFYLGGQGAQVPLRGLHLHCSLTTLQKEKPSCHNALCCLVVPARPGERWFLCCSEVSQTSGL